jgi:hypothetical protein
MTRRTALLALGFFAFGVVPPCGSPARAAETPWGNPFCAASVSVVPWDAATDVPAARDFTDRYVVQLSVDGKNDVAASVTLIGADDAYSVSISRTSLVHEAADGGRYTDPVMVTFPKPLDIHYAYVDSVGVDGAAPAACPTVVGEVRPYDAGDGGSPHMGNGITSQPATLLQALPPLTCGKAYIPPGVPGEGGLIGAYGNTPKTTVVHVYIDSNGAAAKTTLERSSGIEGIDDAALGDAEHENYRPAKFLCTPVVSEATVEYSYNP